MVISRRGGWRLGEISGEAMVVAVVVTSSGAVLGGAAVALVWMGWAFLNGKKHGPASARSKPQRAPKIVRA